MLLVEVSEQLQPNNLPKVVVRLWSFSYEVLIKIALLLGALFFIYRFFHPTFRRELL